MVTTNSIIIADDHPIFREGLTRIVRRVLPGIIHEVSEFAALLKLLETHEQPTILILDLIFPGFDGAQSVNLLRHTCPQSAIIVVSMKDEQQTANAMLNAGANG
ncbi:MAG: response regulator [Paracoccaceae bacterium]